MSQQEPNPKDSSQEPLPKPQSSVTQAQTSELSIKAFTIRTLRVTIRTLESLIEILEAPPGKVSSNSTIATIQSLFGKLWAAFLPVWRKLLEFVRSRLPENLNQKLGDRALSGVLAGTFVLLFWFTSSILSPKPAKPTIATRPPVEVAPAPEKPPVQQPTFEVAPKPSEPFPTDLSAPEPLPEPEVLVPEPEVIAEVPPTESISKTIEETISEVSEPAIEPTEPEEAPEVAPSLEPSPEPIAVAPTEPITPPVPEVELTPEEKLLASIQAQVMETSDQFINGLVTAVSPNFQRGRLMVQVSRDWYRFSLEQQDRFANELWQRSKSLNFPKLSITDANKTLLARDPVIGSSMVILKRKQLDQ